MAIVCDTIGCGGTVKDRIGMVRTGERDYCERCEERRRTCILCGEPVRREATRPPQIVTGLHEGRLMHHACVSEAVEKHCS